MTISYLLLTFGSWWVLILGFCMQICAMHGFQCTLSGSLPVSICTVANRGSCVVISSAAKPRSNFMHFQMYLLGWELFNLFIYLLPFSRANSKVQLVYIMWKRDKTQCSSFCLTHAVFNLLISVPVRALDSSHPSLGACEDSSAEEGGIWDAAVAQIRHGTGDDAQQPHNELPLEDKRRDSCLQSPLRCLLLCRGQNISEFLGFKDTQLLLSPACFT